MRGNFKLMTLPFKMTPLKWLIAGVLVLLLITGGYYNSFVTQTNAIEGQWKQVEVQYQRRVDLIPNLVETVKGLQKQEKQIFGDVDEARKAYAGAKSADQKVAAANQLEGALSKLLAVFENYPQIKSQEATINLMNQLEGTENRIAVERRRYNELVQNYNTSVSKVPGSLFASILGFHSKTYFQSAPGSENAPKVKF